ncbi:hypothetical protein CSCA_3612 [Clostridium scatologenes]|uniref:Uncharacterized protein n=1 Tax=Clostridium scatologenes TaxID=1548 RepID=A0A0E3K2U2_CLOSL|nr:hypothetical protein CSCA_3612 [Clostridium scatologenes]
MEVIITEKDIIINLNNFFFIKKLVLKNLDINLFNKAIFVKPYFFIKLVLI